MKWMLKPDAENITESINVEELRAFKIISSIVPDEKCGQQHFWPATTS